MVAALFASLVSDGYAQVVATPDPARLQAAEAYYVAADYDGDMKVYVDTLVTQYAKAVAQRGGKPDTDTERQVVDLIRPDFQTIIQFRHQQMVRSFAKHLSAEDLIELTKFVHTPLGLRLTKVKPDIVREGYVSSLPLLQSLRITAWRSHLADFNKLGLSFAGVKQQ